MDDMYGTGDIHRDAENDRHHHQEKKRVKGGLIVGRLTQAIDDMVEREVTERLETEYHARSDFAQQAHAAWVAHPEWGASERRLELDDYDEDEYSAHDKPYPRSPSKKRPSTVGSPRRLPKKAEKRFAVHSLGKSPHQSNYTWKEIDEMWLQKNTEREAVHVFEGYEGEPLTKSEFHRRNKYKEVKSKPTINTWGSPRKECLCHSPGWGVGPTANTMGPKKQSHRKSQRGTRIRPPSPPHPNSRARRRANGAYEAPSVGWTPSPEHDPELDDIQSPPEHGTVYKYTPTPLYRTPERDPELEGRRRGDVMGRTAGPLYFATTRDHATSTDWR